MIQLIKDILSVTIKMMFIGIMTSISLLVTPAIISKGLPDPYMVVAIIWLVMFGAINFLVYEKQN